ncbi:MAG: hypothetical protein AMXMBFR47_08610 [Planctomycetota bacterium]
MTFRRSSVALLSAIFVVSMAPAQDPCDDGAFLCGKATALIRAHGDGPFTPDDPDVPQTRENIGDTDVLHCDFEIELFPATSTVAGHNTMTVRSLAEGLTQFTFRLRSNMTVSAVTLNGVTSIPPASVQMVGIYGRRVTLDRAYSLNETFTIRIDYSGAPANVGFGSFMFGSQGGYPMIGSLSEPYYAATWWPVKDGDALDPGDNKDKFTIDTAIIAPAELTSLSNGVLVGVDDLGTRRRFRWSTDYATSTYLVFISSTNYNTWSVDYVHPGGTMPVEFAIFPGHDSSGNRAAWERTLPMLAAFREPFGEYPFINEKYGIYEFQFGGGMEHQTFTGQGTFSEWVTAHELGHQWWGDDVTCRTWHDIWLNEGFATYSEALWAERRPGSSGFPAYRSEMNASRPGRVDDSVYVYDTSSVGRIFSGTFSYAKGGWVLHMLRHVVGDDVFFDILADYRATFTGSAATTDDFTAVASAVSGMDLSTFIEQWVYLPGAPTYEFGWRNVTIADSPYLQLHIRQVQSAAYPTFVMPIDMRIDRSGGSSTTVVQNGAALQHYLIPLPSPATGVALDEFDWILLEGKTAVPYVEGPPKVVALTPSIGAEIESAAAPTGATIQFSEAVSVTAADFVVAGPGGAVPFTLNYASGSYVATLDFGSALTPGSYQVTARSTLRSVAANLALDGEITSAPAPLPSGDGLPGGDAVWTFHVRPACPWDLDGNDVIDLTDLAIILSNFGTTSGAEPADGDIDGDTDVDLQDLAQVLAQFGAACP